MPRQTHTVQSFPNSDPADLASMGTSMTPTLVAAHATDKEQVAFTGVERIIAINTGASPYTVTVDGVKVKGRAGSITAYSIAAGAIAIIALPTDGWRQADGKLYFEASNVAVKFAVIAN
jgi:hypothetical protein